MASEGRRVRLEKLDRLRESGVAVYPERYEVTHTLAAASLLEDGVKGVAVAGRIVAVRRMGKLSFVKLQDLHGSLQLALKLNLVGEESLALFHNLVHIGDFVGARGEVFTTRTGEKTVMVEQWTFLGKSLRPLPEKWHGLSDVEARQRQRYLDLIMNEEARRRLLLRTTLIREVRNFLEGEGFLEVETPVLQARPSGALARPFVTHHNALDIPLYMRIAPETYLKRLIVAGLPRVFEFARCFRNEGMSTHHLQEFTMVEGYAAFYDYEDSIRLLRNLFLHVVQQMFGNTIVRPGGLEVDLAQPWERASFRELILRDTGIDIRQCGDAAALLAEIKARGLTVEHDHPEVLGFGTLVDLLYKRFSRPKLVQPTLLVEHPIDLSPLSRASDADPGLSDRFQLVINGVEIINGYSELVDPVEQARRLADQAAAHARGDAEAMVMDHDYVKAMEYGMPPISGWGFGIERLLQAFTGTDNIKEFVIFPLTRAVTEEPGAGAEEEDEEQAEGAE